MTILQALNAQYERMERRGEAVPAGYSREKISYALVISPDGEPLRVMDLRRETGRKREPQMLVVPASVKRTVKRIAFHFWDKTAYLFGRVADAEKSPEKEHALFRSTHLDLLKGATDDGLVALRRFVEGWTPARFDAPPFTPEMLDANFVFRLDGDRIWLHEREAARRLLDAGRGGVEEGPLCLVTGRRAPTQRLHPTIKNVDGAQSSGASLVSFNLDAFKSYGHEQGDNAPTSQAAAFRYGAALNALLERGTSRNRIKVGDATVAFWADASRFGEEAAAQAEAWFFEAADPSSDEEKATQEDAARVKLHDALKAVAQGRAVAALAPDLPKGLRFHILGLAPNAARLAVRLWAVDDFSVFAARLEKHYAAIALDPPPWGARAPSVQRLLVRTTAVQEKFENIPPHLAGETLRAILTGAPYPRTLLSAAIGRLRAGDDPSRGWHAAVAKAVVNRTEKEQLPVSLDPDHPSSAYQLGRLFRVLEDAQYAALGAVNATIGDRYYAAASATPARVFGPLLRGLRTHVADARKRGKGLWIEPRVTEIMARLPPELPKTLRLEDQARFAVGYYHERAARFEKHNDAEDNTQGQAQ